MTRLIPRAWRLVVTTLVLPVTTLLLLAASVAGQPASGTKAAAKGATVRPSTSGPLVLAKQGSFFVNAQVIETSAAGSPGPATTGHVSTKGMYVQYQIPQTRSRASHPIILIHGSGHTGKTYEETPDGRMGWAEYFVRQGMSTYVVDHSGRARSGFDPSPSNRAKAEGKAEAVPLLSKFTNEGAWNAFRVGPKPFVPYENTKFQVGSQEQYWAQIVPNTEASYADGGRSTVDALAALLDRIGPAVLFVHSQSGGLRHQRRCREADPGEGVGVDRAAQLCRGRQRHGGIRPHPAPHPVRRLLRGLGRRLARPHG